MRRRRGGGGGPGGTRRGLRARLASVLAAVAIVAGASALAGCTAPEAGGGAHFVTPPLVRYSAVLWPVPLQLVGVEPGAQLRITAQLSTARGTWSSAATYTVPASGTLDLAKARPQLAPFAKPDSAGLFWSLRGPAISGETAAGQWMRSTTRVTLRASQSGHVVASRTFELEGLAAAVPEHTLYTRDLRPAIDPRLPRQTHEDVPLATFYSAASLDHPEAPAVLMFDDPSPGASAEYTAPLIAEFGVSVLAVPLSAAADGIRSTTIVSASTVQGLFDWLAARPDIVHDKVFVYGTGAAEQLAVWAATRFPGAVHGLIAAGGVPALLCLPSGRVAPALEDSAGLPCLASARRVVAPAIPSVATVDGPVVLACGEQDHVLDGACDWQRALAATRIPHAGDGLVFARGAGHAVSVPPGLPIDLPAVGGQPTEQARVAFWNAVGGALLRAAFE